MSNLSLTNSFEKTPSPDTHQTDSRFIRVVVMLITLSIAAAILVPNYMHQQMVNEETTVIGITTAIQRRMNGEMAMEILRGTSCPVRLNDRRLLLKNVIASLNLKASRLWMWLRLERTSKLSSLTAPRTRRVFVCPPVARPKASE